MRPIDLVREAVDQAVSLNPRLALEPYAQMKAAAQILAEQLILVRPIYEPCDICGKRHGPHGGICE